MSLSVSVSTVKQVPMLIGAKLLLAVVSPMQGFIDRPGITHEFINQQAVRILRNDGYLASAGLFEKYMGELNAGVYWADKGWKNVSHYFEPTTERGLWHFPNAVDDFREYYAQALIQIRCRDYARAVFFLGAAAHLLQDMCVPHHARAKLFNGHKEYEQWVSQNYQDYGVTCHGIYGAADNPRLWLMNNASIAADFYEWVNCEMEVRYDKATSILLPLAQRTTAGIFEHFCAMIGRQINLKTVVA